MRFQSILAALALLPGVALASTGENLDEAWWTGPMLAASAATLPTGHFLVEPYLFDIVSPQVSGFRTMTYMLYGLTDRVSLGMIPYGGYNEVDGGPDSSRPQLGDLALQAQYLLTSYEEGGWLPTLSAVVKETLPTGRYQRLGDRPADGLGGGAYATTGAIYGQTYFWLPNGRILRMRLDLSETVSTAVPLRGVSVYGSGPGFRGRALPGQSFEADAAWEYSVTQRWVVALDVTWGLEAGTRLQSLDFAENLGSSRPLGFAPAVEYNWRADMGVLVGVRAIPAGRNTTPSLTPAVALNMVF